MATPIFFVQNDVFVSFSIRIVLCRFKRRLKEKRRLNGVFPFSQSQGIDIVYFIDQSTTVSRKMILTVNRLTNEQRCKNIISLLDVVLHKCCVSSKIFKVSFL